MLMVSSSRTDKLKPNNRNSRLQITYMCSERNDQRYLFTLDQAFIKALHKLVGISATYPIKRVGNNMETNTEISSIQ